MVALAVADACAVSVIDDAGKTVKLARPAQRIVTIAPSLAEVTFAAGAGRYVVGVARYSDFPPAVRKLPEVGDAVSIDLERIVALRPDLVLAWQSGNRTGASERLPPLGDAGFAAEPPRLTDMSRLLLKIGPLAGTRSEAERAAGDFERSVSALRGRYAGVAPVRTF